MDFPAIIADKKYGRALTDEQISAFAKGAADGSIPDYQLAALLMAIRLNGMDERETATLTMAMAQSGDMLHPDVGGVAVDKHSTGGVGDTTSLVLVPLCAACGAKIAKMSGRGLGHTGGTVDKMESIGMQTTLTEEEFLTQVQKIGCAIIGQSADLAPADKTLYALRDATATVDSLPLIAASIMSKKLAAGTDGIVLDVKVGSGAIMPTYEGSLELAKAMVDIGHRAGRNVTALLTGMNEPLGSHIGNRIEVKEAIDILRGECEGPLLIVSLKLGSYLLVAGKIAKTPEEGEKMLRQALKDGSGLEKLRELIRWQHGDESVCDHPEVLADAPIVTPLCLPEEGYIAHMNTTALGYASQALGAGRRQKTDVIDPRVGYIMHKRVGDYVTPETPLCTLYAKDEKTLEEARNMILGAITVSKEPCEKERLLYAAVTPEGVKELK
ncbi:MAG: thymidine phosphorylase [Clostridia bacterium]|nr:thymidine phosphorylase [Clostridia bacterium]